MNGNSRWRHTAALLLALALPLPAAALLAGTPEGPDADSPERRIDVAGERSPWSGVGAVVVGGNVYGGALVADRYVLTAAHVVAGVDAATVRFALPRRTAAPLPCAVDAIYVHPDFRGFSPQRPQGDIAMLRLARPAPQWARRYRLAEDTPAPGSLITLVGLGAGSDGYGGGGVAPSPTRAAMAATSSTPCFRHPARSDRRCSCTTSTGPRARAPVAGRPWATASRLQSARATPAARC